MTPPRDGAAPDAPTTGTPAPDAADDRPPVDPSSFSPDAYAAALAPRGERAWWRDAVVYEVYPRSFADSDGDGLGDLAGLRAKLPYLAALGVDAVWTTPCYVSPLRDGGYDVADYRAIDPRLGSVAEMEALVADAHGLGLRVLMDVVPNHTSADHAWFQEALATAPGSREWARYHCVRGRGPDGAQPPNDWRSTFGGPAWTPVPGHGGWWYLHLFDASQPDLDWSNPEVHAHLADVLRFWFDRGVDGFRIDVAHGLVKAAGYPDSGEGADDAVNILGTVREMPQWDRPGVHAVYREWRALADSYDPPRVFCGEVWVAGPERLAPYLRPDELHTAFNFDHLKAPWWAQGLREVVDASLACAGSVGAPTTWVLDNHDVWRSASRYAPPLPVPPEGGAPGGAPGGAGPGDLDLAVGRARARAGLLFMLALPGSAYLYQGQELGLEEVVDLPDSARQDPIFARTGGVAAGRDGCRVPLPWSGDAPPYGFCPDGVDPWLPQPDRWAALTVAAQEGVGGSTLELVRAALAARRAEACLGDGTMAWEDAGDPHVLAARRPGPGAGSPDGGDGAAGVLAVVNMGRRAVALPEAFGTQVLLASGDGVAVEDGRVVLPADRAVWLRG